MSTYPEITLTKTGPRTSSSWRVDLNGHFLQSSDWDMAAVRVLVEVDKAGGSAVVRVRR